MGKGQVCQPRVLDLPKVSGSVTAIVYEGKTFFRDAVEATPAESERFGKLKSVSLTEISPEKGKVVLSSGDADLNGDGGLDRFILVDLPTDLAFAKRIDSIGPRVWKLMAGFDNLESHERSGEMEPQRLYLSANGCASMTTVKIGDVDGDGDIDISILLENGAIMVLHNLY